MNVKNKSRHVVSLLGLLLFLILAVGSVDDGTSTSNTSTKEKSKQKAEMTPATEKMSSRLQSADPEWGIVSHFGLVTTIWVSKDILNDKNMLAQILHTIEMKYGKGIVWFFDSQNHTPTGVPMSDKQMLHWVGLFDPAQGDTFCYIEITDSNSSPPGIRTIKTNIRPGYAEAIPDTEKISSRPQINSE